MAKPRLFEKLKKQFGDNADFLFIDGEITSIVLKKFWQRIFEKTNKNPDQLFILFITTGGGDFDAARDFYCKVKLYNINLVTVAVGQALSAGVTLLLAGNKRFATPHTAFLFHLCEMTPEDLGDEGRLNNATLRRVMRSNAITDKTELGILAEELNIGERRIARMVERETYFLTDTALKIGLVHKLI